MASLNYYAVQTRLNTGHPSLKNNDPIYKNEHLCPVQKNQWAKNIQHMIISRPDSNAEKLGGSTHDGDQVKIV